MEDVPVEVIGEILSRVETARDIVIASATCRKWRKAFTKHLHTLSFNSNDLPFYGDLTSSKHEILITQTIFQTTGLQKLSILKYYDNDDDEFSASALVAWLMYTRETLKQLFYNVKTSPNINILELCGRQHQLEKLVLGHNSIIGVEPNFQRFPCLKSLSLGHVSISALDLNYLLAACPKIESLELVAPEILISDPQVTVELASSKLKNVYVEGISLEKFILEADCIERLHFKDCVIDVFELIGKGTLKHFEVDKVTIIHFEIGDTHENLEIVDISSFTIIWPNFHQMITRFTKLRRLRLWDIDFGEEDEIVDLETIAVCFPQLRSLSYDLKEWVLLHGLQGDVDLENLVVVELRWTTLTDLFVHWVEGVLNRCPNLQKLVIYGIVSGAKTREECQILANFTTSIVQLMRRFIHVDVQFEYE
ncbi:hypothetical protein CsatB_027950 [Cannabis sativa]|uniref:F-box domain-containing protein n=2 Tax=Cannabis sativa TaxID=3483 RepID=A0AB40E7S0_CANSA|nr:F-box/LRR-repeat protein At1g67190 [Cannabis sativa]KAF4379787.1 hypothetical protein F8388_023804 [Cannabis sativa]KAF4388740.1 hypothetical protein G4B88_019017 [Cannabis sativa]